MPKVILGEKNKRDAAFWEYVDSKIWKGALYRTDGEFAEKALGYTNDGFSKWRNKGIPKFFQVLCRIFQVTRIKDYQLCKIFGVEYK